MTDDQNLIRVDDTPDPLLWISEYEMAEIQMWAKLQLVMGLFVGAFAGAFFVFVLPCLFLDACRMVGFGWGSGAMMVVAGTFGMRARANGLKTPRLHQGDPARRGDQAVPLLPRWPRLPGP